ncbi:MAG: radical SAM protein [Thermoplasmatota archaeon]
MFEKILLMEYSSSIPQKKELKIRKESFGHTIFNPEDLFLLHVGEEISDILFLIDGKKTIEELFELYKEKKVGSRFVDAVFFLNSIAVLQGSGFIEMDKEIPQSKYFKSKEKYPFLSAPNQLSWIITNECNLRCSHCANRDNVKRKRELSTTEAIDCVKGWAENGVFIINVSGGEPFIRPDIFQILGEARKSGIEVGITTNGTLIDDEMATKIKELDTFNIHISLDGVGKVHDDFRNMEGVFEKVMNTISLFRKYKIPFGVTTSISKKNFDDLDNIKELIIQKKITSWEIFYAIPLGNLSSEMSLSKGEYVKLADKVSEFRHQLEGKCKVFVGDSLGYHSNHDLRDHEWKGCMAGLNHAAIGPEGEIKGCPIQPDNFVVGNIRTHDFFDLWRNINTFSFNRKERELDGFCAKCKYSVTCRGGCVTSMVTQGTDLKHNDLCLYEISRNN